MEKHLKEKLEQYLDLLEQIKGKVQDDSTAARILGEIAKDARMEQIREERDKGNGDPATEKQRNFLKRLGVDIGDEKSLTKQEASKLIDEELAKDNGEV